MKEPGARRLWIEGPAGRLECFVRFAHPCRGRAVLAHPHPAYGGTLHNPVIFHADRELHRAGWTTLRFNFRGVGASDGTHDGGRGEVDDVAAATSWVRALHPGTPLILVGYSFGAWCALRHALDEPIVTALVAVGLPLRVHGFESLRRLRRPVAVVQASDDALGSPEEVRTLLSRTAPEGVVRVVRGTDHLFAGRAAEAAARIVEAARDIVNR